MTCVEQGEEAEKACMVSHNCLAEADQSSWVTDTRYHVFQLVQEQRAQWLHLALGCLSDTVQVSVF
jgi:hypothetical protein